MQAQQVILVIDVQQALCTGPYAAFEAAEVVQRINTVTARARAAGLPVILIQHESPDGELAHGSQGWQLAAGLNVQADDIHLRKTATDSFHRTELQTILQRCGAEHLIICGLQSDFCVDTTTRRALALGYPVSLISDGHSTLDNGLLSALQIREHHTLTLSNIESFGPRVTPVAAADIRFE